MDLGLCPQRSVRESNPKSKKIKTKSSPNPEYSLAFFLYYAWSCELAHLHAKYLARCIMARARRSSEVADNKAKTRADVRAPTASYYADQFFPR